MRRKRWDTVRFTLGMMQMATATVAGVLLFRTGVTTWSLTAAVMACALTTMRVVMFGARRPRLLSRINSPRRR